MLALHVCARVEAGVVSSDGNDRHAAASVCTAADELVICVFEEIMLGEEQEGVCILREYTDCCVDEVTKVELPGEYAIQRSSSADSDAFGRGVETDEARRGGESRFGC